MPGEKKKVRWATQSLFRGKQVADPLKIISFFQTCTELCIIWNYPQSLYVRTANVWVSCYRHSPEFSSVSPLVNAAENVWVSQCENTARYCLENELCSDVRLTWTNSRLQFSYVKGKLWAMSWPNCFWSWYLKVAIYWVQLVIHQYESNLWWWGLEVLSGHSSWVLGFWSVTGFGLVML